MLGDASMKDLTHQILATVAKLTAKGKSREEVERAIRALRAAAAIKEKQEAEASTDEPPTAA
jgi:hypothetical protein